MIKHPTKAYKNIRLASPLGHLGVPPDALFNLGGKAAIIITNSCVVNKLMQSLNYDDESFSLPQ